MNTTRVTFRSDGTDCIGRFYRPDGPESRLPCIVLCHGFSGTADWILPEIAQRFAAAGFAAFTFDYRHFGESGGEPRQLVSVKRQRDDIRAALHFVRGHAGIDSARVTLWGTSLGGGHVIALAAEDFALGAAIAQVPGIDMVRKEARATIAIPVTVTMKLIAAAVWDALRGVLGLQPYYVKVFGEPGERAMFTDPALKPRFEALERGSTQWRNRFTPRFLLAAPRYHDGTAEAIVTPLLVCVADGDVYANPRFQAEVGNRAPRGEVRHYPGEHFDFYHRLLDTVSRDQVEFLRRHLDGRDRLEEGRQTGTAARSQRG